MKISEIVIGTEYVTTNFLVRGAHVRASEIIKPEVLRGNSVAQRMVRCVLLERHEDRLQTSRVWEAGTELDFAPRDLELWAPYYEQEQRKQKNADDTYRIARRVQEEAGLKHPSRATWDREVAVTMTVEEWEQWLDARKTT